ncbi:DNA excision repair protein ERCC-1 [Condylostylus longicornis]|uniref:DNA excision repair protein ERCC-1 n=1 Tax=Condylostylus longicornis TaxID=2530218 RepID=UPI00244E5007|nr:DNA excision repair protein ERCC-1 [Condylostylus longicornis]
MDHEIDDSFDDALANVCIATEPKVMKLSKPESTSSSIQANAKNQQDTKLNPGPTKSVSSSYSILVHSKQRGNPLLKSIGNCPIEYRDDIPADYIVGRTTCILYLSLQYYHLHPDYICERLKILGNKYELRVLLIQVDIPEPYKSLKNLTRICLLADLTMVLAWNADEAGKIIENYKLLEKKPPDMIMERIDSNPHQKLTSALTNIKPINKTDAITLLQNFGSLENIILASEDRLSLVTGLGPRKAKKLHKTLNEPFLRE